MSVTVKGINYEVKKTYEGRTLVLQDADITSIKEIVGLDKLNDLEVLYLNKNQITKIEGLEGLTSLKSLDLGSNKITKIVRHSEVLARS